MLHQQTDEGVRGLLALIRLADQLLHLARRRLRTLRRRPLLELDALLRGEGGEREGRWRGDAERYGEVITLSVDGGGGLGSRRPAAAARRLSGEMAAALSRSDLPG